MNNIIKITVYSDMGHLMHDPLNIPKFISNHIFKSVEMNYETYEKFTIRVHKMKPNTPKTQQLKFENSTYLIKFDI